MTIPYMREVRTSGLITFGQLLFRWEASVWKNIGKELYLWIVLYLVISGVYRFKLRGTPSGDTFEQFVFYCNMYVNEEPLFFLLGFYVQLVARRWWSIYMRIPWPDDIALSIATYFRSNTDDEKVQEKEKAIRRTMVRYLIVAFVLVLRDISKGVKMRFPEMKHLVDFGLLTDEERQKLDAIVIGGVESECVCKYWVPMQWICTIVRKCHIKKGIISEIQATHLVEHVLQYRTKLSDLLSYDWVGIPLVYTQVVNLATLVYFFIGLFSYQYIGTNRFPQEPQLEQDYVVPFFPILQFVFYYGWLKVAQVMINPFGMNDDDFECNFLIERHLEVANLMVDEMYDNCPSLVDEESALKHTFASLHNATKTNDNRMVGSAATMYVPSIEAVMLLPQTDYFTRGVRRRTANSADGPTQPSAKRSEEATSLVIESPTVSFDRTQPSLTTVPEQSPV